MYMNTCDILYPRNMACFRYIIVKILHNNNNNNNNNKGNKKGSGVINEIITQKQIHFWIIRSFPALFEP
jgi:hypothetical protein